MSGGVDSAVALLKAGPAAVGVTLRLWIDPLGPDVERACCSPAAVIAARETCHSRGLPHITLDLREQFRAVVVEPFVAGYAAGETPNPCVSCNGNFRFDELLAFVDRIGATRLATGHYVRIVERDGVRRSRVHTTSRMTRATCSRRSIQADRSALVPLGEQTKAETRAEAEAAGLAAAARRKARKPVSSAGATIATSSAVQDWDRIPARSSTSRGRRSAAMTGSGGSPGQRKGPVSSTEPLYAVATDAQNEHGRCGAPGVALARDRVSFAVAWTVDRRALTPSFGTARPPSLLPSCQRLRASSST